MTERQKTDLSPQKRSLKLTPALGDWTTYKPARNLIKRVKSGLYGFDRLSKEELEFAHEIHYRFAEELCETIRIDLGIRGEVYVVDALQTNYSNFIRMLSQPLVEGTISLEEIHEDAFFSVDLSLVNTIINYTLGSSDQESIQRELTEAEYKVLNSTFSNYVNIYNDSFSGTLLNPKLSLNSSPQVNPSVSISPSQSFICFVIEIKLNESYGKIVCGYSGKTLKQLIDKTKKQSQSTLKIKRLSPQMIGQINQELTVKLGTTQITSHEINSLEVGDVISLNQSIFSGLSGYLGGEEILIGQPGVNNKKVSLKIVSVSKDQSRFPEIKIAPPPVEEKEENIETEEIIAEEDTIEDNTQTEDIFEDKPEEEFEKEYPEEEMATDTLAEDEYNEDNLDDNIEKKEQDEDEDENEDDFSTDDDFSDDESDEEDLSAETDDEEEDVLSEEETEDENFDEEDN